MYSTIVLAADFPSHLAVGVPVRPKAFTKESAASEIDYEYILL